MKEIPDLPIWPSTEITNASSAAYSNMGEKSYTVVSM